MSTSHVVAPGASQGGFAPERRGARRWFADRRVNTKLSILLVTLLFVAGGVGVTAVLALRTVAGAAHSIHRDGAAPLEDLAEARVANGGMRQRVLLHLAGPVAEKPVRERQIVELDATFDAKIASFGEHFADQQLLESYLTALREYRTFRDTTILPASRAMSGDVAPILAECDRLYAKLEDLGNQLGHAQVAAVERTAAQAEAAYSDGLRTLLLILLLGAALGTGLAIFVGRQVVGPLRQVKGALDAMADGDLTSEVRVESRDELGQMASALTTAQTAMRTTIRSMARSAEGLAAASTQLSTTSATLEHSAEQTSAQADVVAGAADEVSRNVQTVAAGTDEMGASIREIASNASEATQVAAEAVAAAIATNSTVSRLGESSSEIGNVVKLITSIAEQTNLLALNATIEAARAGEMGKGFAVVANEVKELAQETSKATEDIARRVQTIQTDTAGAVTAIEQISAVITKISDYQTTIASAVEEQSATTNEMSRNVAEAAASSSQIAGNISSVASAAQQTTGGAASIAEASTELSRMAQELQQLVGAFRY